MYDIAFVVEQVLGHVTHGANLQRHVADHPEVRPHWVFAPFESEGLANRIPVYRSNWTIRGGLRSRAGLRRVRRSAELDAIFFHTQVPAILSPDHLRRIPSVVSLDATPRQYDELGDFYAHAVGSRWTERIKTRIAASSFRAARHLVTWSEWAKRGLVDDYGVPEDKVTVIAPGVSCQEWARSEPRTIEDGSPVRLLFVGGDLERKGGGDLIESFKALRDRYRIELHLVTRDDVDDERGIIVHHGLTANSPELLGLYHECDVFVLPTYGDCLPMVLSEAGAAGLPAISTSVAAIPEVVRDGTTGLVVPPGDVAALTGAVRRLLERPEERLSMGRRATEHIARNYDSGTNTGRLVTILERVADGVPVGCDA